MFWVAAELQDVPLGEANTLKKLRPGVRQSLRVRSALPRRKAIKRVHELNVRASTFQEIRELFAPYRAVVCASALFSCCALDGFLLLHVYLSGTPLFFRDENLVGHVRNPMQSGLRKPRIPKHLFVL